MIEQDKVTSALAGQKLSTLIQCYLVLSRHQSLLNQLLLQHEEYPIPAPQQPVARADLRHCRIDLHAAVPVILATCGFCAAARTIAAYG